MRRYTNEAQQLNNWAANNQNATSNAVTTSQFYIDMQNETYLDYSDGRTFDYPFGATELTQGAALLLANIMADSTSLTTLNLSGNQLGGDILAIVNILARSTSLTSVDLSNNNIGNNAVAVAAKLTGSPSLTSLNLSDNNLGYYTPNILTAISMSQFNKINIATDSDTTRNNEPEVSTIFKQYELLTELNMGYNVIPNNNIEAFITNLGTPASSANLEHLYCNAINPEMRNSLTNHIDTSDLTDIVAYYLGDNTDSISDIKILTLTEHSLNKEVEKAIEEAVYNQDMAYTFSYADIL
jgi:hypothetical protein